MNFNMFWFIVVGVGALGAALAGIGGWGLLRRRPLVLPERYFTALILLALAASAIDFVRKVFDPRLANSWPASALVVMLFAALAVVFWLELSGYVIFGASDTGFRNALHNALNRLSLPFEEVESHTFDRTISRIRLTSVKAEVRAAGGGRLGTSQLRITPRRHAATLRQIAGALTDEFATATEHLRHTSLVIYLVMGLAVIVMAVVLGVYITGSGL